MGGDTKKDPDGFTPGIYGVLGQQDPANVPGSRQQSATWADSAGNVWLFGGLGADANGEDGDLNDFWKFDPSANEWTWVGGSDVMTFVREWPVGKGVYGALGVSSPRNIPEGRDAAAFAYDGQDRLWLFGGSSVDPGTRIGCCGTYNDLWAFDLSTHEWTWMSGAKVCCHPGSYGTLGQAGRTNSPDARSYAASWSDDEGNFWLFGGYSDWNQGQGRFYLLNNLWEFDAAKREWAWVDGRSHPGSHCIRYGYDNYNFRYNYICGWPGTYGAMGVFAPANIPGSREKAISWKDTSGRFWLFGGWGVDVHGAFGYLNDLWVFDVRSKEWAWVGGSSEKGADGVYGVKGTPSPKNAPGARTAGNWWVDRDNHLWIFGGTGRDAAGHVGALSDLWEYLPSSLAPAAA
ncbi:MAG TPA: kelch repeat-containing protein, partial [Terracidiphilus sp.]|nr:kelch repeat-containing protein [Terracidiphilus sp.]